MKRILICGATGFIGRNLLERFARRDDYRVAAVYHDRPAVGGDDRNVEWVHADLRNPQDVDRVVKGIDIVIQAAATTSGARDIVTKPHTHITDNVVMNSYLFRACHELGVERFIFLSCSVMYPDSGGRALKESDFNGRMDPKYFGGGWNKVYMEKMCEFFAGLGAAKYTAIRHSNIYGPHDKFDLERSHLFGATVAKVMEAPDDGEIIVWGDGSEKRDLLHVDDLVEFIELCIARQSSPFELVNAGAGRAVSVRELVEKIVKASGKNLKLIFDTSKPTIPFSVALDSTRARELFGWTPKISLEDGIARTLDWYANFR